MLLDGDPQWQRWLFYAATAFLIWEIWRGWRLGAVRGLLRLAALFCAWIAGTTTAGATGTVVAFFSKVPPLFAPAVVEFVNVDTGRRHRFGELAPEIVAGSFAGAPARTRTGP